MILTKAQAALLLELLFAPGIESHNMPAGTKHYNGRAMKILENLDRLGLVEWDWVKLYTPRTLLEARLTPRGYQWAVARLLTLTPRSADWRSVIGWNDRLVR
jgi:hypothetical protein